ncbi:NAD(P)-dependent oxidoreductase [Acidobacteriota bacterium]
MKKILVADALASDALDALQSIPGLEVVIKTGMDEADLVKTVPGFNGMVIRSATKVTRPVIESMDTMEVIVRAGIGLDNIDLVAAKEHGVDVNNTPSATTFTVSEHTFGMMLGVVRNHGPANVSMKQHKWEKKLFKGTELYEKTLGIIGSGRIGLDVAKKAIAFGMKVLAYDLVDIDTDLDVKQVSLDELLANSDLISLHLPLTDSTRHMIGDQEFEKMKSGVIIVNAARGGVVAEDALLRALNSGKVRAAAIDVYEKEPTDNFELIDHPMVTALPHIGAAAGEGQQRAGFEVVSILKNRFAG